MFGSLFGKRKNAFRSRRREVRQLKRRVIVSTSVALGILSLSALVWYSARRPEVTISSVEVTGGETVPHEVVAQKADAVLSGTYAFLIPRRFSFFFPQKDIVTAINSIPRVHDATALRSSRNDVIIHYSEYTPYALWCDVVPQASSTPPNCMFVDERGFSYAPSPSLMGETLLRFVIDGRAPERGVFVYDTQTLDRYRRFAGAIAEKYQQHLLAITETKEGDLVLHLSDSVDILATKTTDIADIFRDIESMFQSDEFKHMPLEHFEYIDLRFGNKIYAKERGVEATSTATTSPVSSKPMPQPASVPVAPTTTPVAGTSTPR